VLAPFADISYALPFCFLATPKGKLKLFADYAWGHCRFHTDQKLQTKNKEPQTNNQKRPTNYC
jgi:hypothetical protein